MKTYYAFRAARRFRTDKPYVLALSKNIEAAFDNMAAENKLAQGRGAAFRWETHGDIAEEVLVVSLPLFSVHIFV